MTRWILDLLRLSAFCGLFLFTATTVLAGEDEPEKEEKTFGIKVEIEDGELKIEQTGDADLDELTAVLEGKIAKIVEQIAENGDVQVKVQALVENAGDIMHDLPIEEMLKAIKGEIEGAGEHEIEANVEVEVDDSKDGERRIEIRKIVTGDDEDEMMDIIKGLKDKGENVWVEKLGGEGQHRVEIRKIIKGGEEDDVLEVIKGLKDRIKGAESHNVLIEKLMHGADGHDDVRMLFVPDGEDMPRATHRLGIAIGSTAGLVIHDVGEDSAAEAAGLKGGDILLAVDGDHVEGVGQLVGRVNDAGQEGRAMKLLIVRGDDVMTVMAEPKEVEHAHDDDDDDDHHDGHDDDDDHEHHEHGDHDHDLDHDHSLEQARDRARALAEEAGQMKMRVQKQLERGQAAQRADMEKVERELRAKSRMVEREAREMRRERDSVSNLKKEMKELREMVKELKEALEEDE